MKTLLATMLLACCGIASAAAHNYKAGKLVDVSVDQRLNEGTTFRRAILKVQLDGIEYTLQGERINTRTKDYANGLIVGDPIQVDLDGSYMHLMKPNGKDMKASILKRERLLPAP